MIVCLGLWYINPWRLFMAKLCLYVYIKYVWLVNTFLDIIFNESMIAFFI